MNENTAVSRQYSASMGNGCLQSDVGREGNIIIDAAWRKDDLWASAAWCAYSNNAEGGYKFSNTFRAYSLIQDETIACLQAVVWARQNGWKKISIISDCLLMVQAMCYPDQADHKICSLIKA